MERSHDSVSLGQGQDLEEDVGDEYKDRIKIHCCIKKKTTTKPRVQKGNKSLSRNSTS